jgi:hypothetical protein
MLGEWHGRDPLLLSIQEEVLRCGVEEVNYVIHVVPACLWEFQRLQQPVLFQVLRVGIVVELLQHLANLSDGWSDGLLC